MTNLMITKSDGKLEHFNVEKPRRNMRVILDRTSAYLVPAAGDVYLNEYVSSLKMFEQSKLNGGVAAIDIQELRTFIQQLLKRLAKEHERIGSQVLNEYNKFVQNKYSSKMGAA